MSLNCRVFRDEKGQIDFVNAPNGNRSKLFDTLVNITGGNKNTALNIYALTETEELKDAVKAKINSFKERFKNVVKIAPSYSNMNAPIEEIRFSKIANTSGYFSNALSAISNLSDKSPKNTQGWIKQLTDVQKNGGVKNVNQELQWIGLEDYLNDYVKENKPKAGNIPYSVVEDYIKLNQIEIVDVTKGDNNYEKRKQREFLEQQQSIALEEGDYEAADYYERQIERLEDTADTSNLQTKYSGYQLKGGENYIEVLLTMPPKKVLKSKSGFYSPEYLKEQEDLIQELKSKGYTVNKEGEVFDLEGNNIPYGENKIPDDIEEFIDNINYEAYYTDKEFYETTEEGYRSSHWSEENILAHVRMNEKTLPDGRKVLIVNEIQADISQDLKKEQDKILDRVDKDFDNFLDNLIMNKVIIEEC